jgi:hypothetical protein
MADSIWAGATHSFFLVADVPAHVVHELIIIMEAASIAAMNTNGKGGIQCLKFLQQHGALPPTLSAPWSLNRSNALLDWEAADGLTPAQRADMSVNIIVAKGGVMEGSRISWVKVAMSEEVWLPPTPKCRTI